jgi:hypothetical protein
MRTLLFALALLIAPAITHAQSHPAGVGFALNKEAVRIKGCDSMNVVHGMALQVFGDGSFLVATAAGAFTGFLNPLDSAGRVWALVFDGPSASDYVGYLGFVASILCRTVVTIEDQAGFIVLKMSEDRTAFSLQLKAVVLGRSAFGPSVGQHQMTARGDFAPAFPAPEPSSSGLLAAR